MLQQRWGTISDFSPLAEGLGSQAFGFRHGAADYVVRINQSIDGFTKDRFVYHSFASPDLPIPEVLDIGHLDDTHAFCVSHRMPGVRLQDMDDAHLSQLVGPTENWWRRSPPQILEEHTGLDDSIPLESARMHAGMIS